MGRQFYVEPEWFPIETAPKTRPIMLYALSAGFDSPKINEQYTEVYWGIMEAFPSAPEWLPVGGSDNSSYMKDAPFIREVFTYNDHGRETISYLWRGFRALAWAELHYWRNSIHYSPPDFNISNVWQKQIPYEDKLWPKQDI